MATLGGKLVIGRNVETPDGSILAADDVRIAPGARIANLAGNRIRKGTEVVIRGFQATAPFLPLPLDLSPATPPTCLGANLAVGAAEHGILAPGIHGVVRVGRGATLTLAPGAYDLCALYLSRGAILELQGPTASLLTISGDMRFGVGGTIAVAPGTPAPRFEVGGRVVRLTGTTFVGHLRAPEASVMPGRGLAFHGTLLAKRVTTDHACRLFCPPSLGGP